MKREAFERLREAYENVSMPEKGVTEMKKKIEEGKRQARRRKNLLLTLKGAAAAAAVFIILPNTSAGVAYAMSSIPVVGRLVEAVTFRDYRYEDERHSADVEVPGLITENTAGIAETVESADGERQERLQKTAEEINQEIETITGQLIAEFEENLKMKSGSADVKDYDDHETHIAEHIAFLLTENPSAETEKRICAHIDMHKSKIEN